MTSIVFLLGEMGVGKDTVAEEFVKNGFVRVSFADALKQEYAHQNNIDVRILHTQGLEKESHRLKLIEVAEEARKKNPLVWLNKAFEPYIDPSTHMFKKDVKLVVSDNRRVSEVEWYYNLYTEINHTNDERGEHICSSLKLALFHIVRPKIVDSDTLTALAIGTAYGIDLAHPGFINAVINNDSTKEALKEKIKNLIFSFHFNI